MEDERRDVRKLRRCTARRGDHAHVRGTADPGAVRDPSPVGRPARLVVELRIVREPRGLPAVRGDRPEVPLPATVRLVDDALAVRRPCRVVAVVHELDGRPAERGHDEEIPAPSVDQFRERKLAEGEVEPPPVVACRAERDLRSVGGPRGLRFVGVRCGHPDRRPATARLDDDVEISALVRDVGEELAVGREGRLLLQPGRERGTREVGRGRGAPQAADSHCRASRKKPDGDAEEHETGAIEGLLPGHDLGGRRARNGHRGEVCRHLPKIARQVFRRRVALVGVLRQAALHDPSEGRRCRPSHRCQRLRLLAKDCGQRLWPRGAVERAAPGGHFVEDRSERELVRAEVQRLADGLLR